jgi:hypothetical protein
MIAGSVATTPLVVLQTGITFDEPMRAAVALVGFALVALAVTGTAAVVYRWYFRELIPHGVTLILGIAVVALYLNTVSLGEIAVGSGSGLFDVDAVLFHVVAIGVGAVISPVGRRVGDAIAVDVFAFAGGREIEGELGRMVRSVGRVTAVTLPEQIEDIAGYDPASATTKAEMAGKTLIFPRKLTVAELRDRLITRLKDDYRVGHVDVDLTADGTVEYLGVGSRAAGLGPTLAPGGAAIAIHADPANSASSGDAVQVWTPPPDPEYVVTAELRATAGDVVTLAIDEDRADALTESTRYRLLTLPTDPRADREFASLLRSADETMAVVDVGSDSDLVGDAIGDLEAAVVAVRPATGEIEPLPARSREILAGDALYAIARPETLRQLESRATGSAGEPATATQAVTEPRDGQNTSPED